MNSIIEDLLMHFLRIRRSPFTIKHIFNIMGKLGYKLSVAEITDFLHSCPYVFVLKNNTYISRAGAFTGVWFSIKLSAAEIKHNFLLAGHRCMPFVDADMPPGTLTFMFRDKRLPHTSAEFTMNDALPYFSLYGTEYAPQYLAADPACADQAFFNPDSELPQKVKLTVTDMSDVYFRAGLQSGDTLLCRVTDWNNGVVEVIPVSEKKENPFKQEPVDEKRNLWYTVLENALLDSFRTRGPGISIEDQLAFVFFEHREKLCVPECGSIEKYLHKAKRVAVELFGVETRLWYKGQEVPAVGEWNFIPESEILNQGDIGLPYLPLTRSILDSYIADAIYQKNDAIESIFDRLFPQPYSIDSFERKKLLLQIEMRHDILKKQYNWFADFEIGPVRHRMLELYSRVSQLMCELDVAGNSLALFPQQPLVILSQLFNHISHILDSLLHDQSLKSEDIRTIDISLEGMEYNFEDISEDLADALNAYRKNSFSVIKSGT